MGMYHTSSAGTGQVWRLGIIVGLGVLLALFLLAPSTQTTAAPNQGPILRPPEPEPYSSDSVGVSGPQQMSFPLPPNCRTTIKVTSGAGIIKVIPDMGKAVVLSKGKQTTVKGAFTVQAVWGVTKYTTTIRCR